MQFIDKVILIVCFYNISVSSVECEAICEIILDSSSVHVFLVVSEIEERLEGVLSEGVIWVDLDILWLVGGCLDVPEGVVGDCLENLESSWLCHTLGECFLEILDVVVVIAFLENGEFFVHLLLKIFNSVRI